MKGQSAVIDRLNSLLADELTAISQYMVHAEMCEDWGYSRLHEAVEKRAMQEMVHAEKLIGRILFLEGKPVVSKLHPMHIGETVPEQLSNDLQSEMDADKSYNEAIRVMLELGDNGTRELLESILTDEEVHIDWLETQLEEIEQMGLQTYLGHQV